MDTKNSFKKLDSAVHRFTEKHPRVFIAIMFVFAVWLSTLVLDVIVMGFGLINMFIRSIS
jgi:hypothetical protein